MNKFTASVIAQLTILDENGNAVAFDFDSLVETIKELQAVAKEKRAENKDAEKAKKEADRADASALAKAYYDTLNEGDQFEYVTAAGNKFTLTKIATKSKSGLTAAGELDSSLVEAGKSNKRYPKFYQLVVPADFSVKSEQVA